MFQKIHDDSKQFDINIFEDIAILVVNYGISNKIVLEVP